MKSLRFKEVSAEQQYSCHKREYMRFWSQFAVWFGLLLWYFGTLLPTNIQAQYFPDELPFPQAHFAVYLDAKPARILTVVELSGRLYAEPIALAEALDCDLRAEGTVAVLLLPSHVLAFAVDAHCVAVQSANSDTVSLTQMLHPVALQSGRILLPLDDILRLLADNGVFEVDERDADIFLKSYGESTPNTVSQAPPESIPMGLPPAKPAQSSAEQPSSAPKPFRKPTRNLYILPNDVKRREMDSLPEKTSLAPLPIPHQRFAVSALISRFFAQSSSKKTTESHHAQKPVKPSMGTASPSAAPHGDNDFTSAKKKWALDVIVLDAGHGGKDAGTIGFGKTKEKDVALGIVKKLGALLKKELPGTKIIYTRTDDTFVELDRRGQIANENGGKLFISIHCNSTPKKPSKANGFEVYILRPGRNDDAVRVAEMENAVIKLEDNPKRYKPLTDEQFIVVSMAQSAFVKYSDMVAGMINAEVKKLREIGTRGVNQAGFLVLVGASMPNMLIETGFLSNKKDEKFLQSERGQTQMASAICRAIKAYRVRYEAQIKGQATSGTTTLPSPKPSAIKRSDKNVVKQSSTSTSRTKSQSAKSPPAKSPPKSSHK